MRKPFLLTTLAVAFAAASWLALAPFAEGGGGRGGAGGGGGGGGFGRGGGFGGGGMRGGMGGFFGGPGGRMGTGAGMGMGANRFTNRGNQDDQKQQELEDRKALIAERRDRLADADRAVNQEARLANERVAATGEAAGDAIY